MSDKLGDMLLRAGLISKEQLASALEYQGSLGGRLGVILVKLNFLKEQRLVEFLAEQQKLPVVHLKDWKLDPALLKLVPRDFAERHEFLPLSREGDVLTVATPDPTDYPAIDELAFMTGLKVQTVLATHSEVIRALQGYYYGQGQEQKPRARAPTEFKRTLREAEHAAAQTPAPPAAESPAVQAPSRGARGAPPALAQPLPEKAITVDGDKLARALAGLLVEKNVLSLDEIMKRVARQDL